MAEHPEWVGNRDRIAAAAREDANRHLLATETQGLDRELADATTSAPTRTERAAAWAFAAICSSPAT